jgi:succinate-acetate transporter protein
MPSARSGAAAEVGGVARIVLRPMGSPLPLGLFALMTGTIMLAALELGWIPASQGRVVALVAVAFAGPLELVAALLSFFARDALAGTGLAVFAGVWVTTGLTLLMTPAGLTSDALGIFLCIGAFALVLLAVAAGTGKGILVAVILAGFARLLATGLYELIASDLLKAVAGISGLVLGAVAAYGALALLMEDQRRRTVLPVARRGEGATPLEGGLGDQLERLEHEAGVRSQL